MAKQTFADGTEVASFYVRTIRSGPLVFVAGTTSLDPKGRIQGKGAAQQTAITMRKIEAGLKSAGARRKDLTRLTIYVTDIRDMGTVSRALARALKGGVVVSTLVEVSRAGGARAAGGDRGHGRRRGLKEAPWLRPKSLYLMSMYNHFRPGQGGVRQGPEGSTLSCVEGI